VRAAFAANHVQLVLVLGGMGSTRREIATLLGALTDEWLLLAIPGDRERIADFRGAIDDLEKDGRLVVDGSQIRVVEIDRVAVATLPGESSRLQLIAGGEGCVYSTADAEALAGLLSQRDRVRIWAAHSPPRQSGSSGSDLAAEGVHIGDLSLVGAVRNSRAHLVLSGLVDEAFPAKEGWRTVEDGETAFLAVGAIEAAPREDSGRATSSAIVVDVRPSGRNAQLHWRPLRFQWSDAGPQNAR
jgi:hypothetical protein